MGRDLRKYADVYDVSRQDKASNNTDMKKCYFPVLVSAFLAFSAASSAIAAPVAWWRFEDSIGSGILANSGTGGAVYDAARKSDASFSSNVSGPYIDNGAGVYYSNSSSYVNGDGSQGSVLSLAASSGFSNIFTGSFTIEALVYFTGTPFFSAIFDDGTNLIFGTEATNHLRFYGVPTAGGSYVQPVSAEALVTDQWYSLAAVGTHADGVTSIQLYINGVASGAAVNAVGGLYVDPSLNFLIGAPNSFPGYIDELRISNEALAPSAFLSASAVPEPSTYLLLGVGLLVLGSAVHKRTVAATSRHSTSER